jgi:hypothetical protein
MKPVAADPSGEFFYAANNEGNCASSCTIEKTGDLVEISGEDAIQVRARSHSSGIWLLAFA